MRNRDSCAQFFLIVCDGACIRSVSEVCRYYVLLIITYTVSEYLNNVTEILIYHTTI